FGGEIINANNYEGIPARDKKFWHDTRTSYEFISRFRAVPFIGLTLFLFFDSFQKILGYYPKRDLSKTNLVGRSTAYLIRKGWGRHLIQTLAKNPIPFVTTFFTPAFMADFVNYPNVIYSIICDADVARAWVALDSSGSRIKYCAPNTWVRDRLKLYGVKPENIIFTG